MIKKKTLLSLVALSSLALAACDTTDDMNDNDTNTTPPVEEPADDTADDTTGDTTDEKTDNVTFLPEEVYDVFLDKYPNAVVTKIQLDKKTNGYEYEVQGFEGDTEYELKIDPNDGSILKDKSEKDNDIDEKEITRDQVLKVLDLVDAALAEAGAEATLKEWTIDEDDGIVKLEVEMDIDGLDDPEYSYNVETGELIDKDD